MPENIGFIGLGVMGKPMAMHLVAAGHRLVVHNRSRGTVDELVAAGATAASSPADVARKSTIVITMLPDTADVDAARCEVTGDDEPDALAARQQGDLVIELHDR